MPGWRRAAAVAVAAVLGLSLAGIGGALASADGGATASRAAGVKIAGFSYKPATLRVAKGTRVTFANNSNTAHTATRAGSFTTGRIKPGKAATIRFARKGTFAYHCTIHPFMRGKVIVG
jgi:plastocyanin